MSQLRSEVLRIASSLPKGDATRVALLRALVAGPIKPYDVNVALEMPNIYWDDPEMVEEMRRGIQTVLNRGVEADVNPVGVIKGGRVQIKNGTFFVKTTFYPADEETIMAVFSKLTGFYTTKKLWPFFWTLAARGGLFTQVRKVVDWGEVLDISWYSSGSTSQSFKLDPGY